MILRELTDLIDIACKCISDSNANIKICELGDQLMDASPYKTGKAYILSKGVKEHVSIDLNGKNGAIPIDLSKPIDRWKDYFDIVTDYGTIEHVIDQYWVFKNVHNMIKIGGTIIHTLPQIGYYKNHCDFHYDINFFEEMARLNNYSLKLLESRTIHGRRGNRNQNLVCCIFLKQYAGDFMKEEDFYKNKGLHINAKNKM